MSNTSSTDIRAAARWFGKFKPSPRAQLRLFCFPHAGGSSLTYRNWTDGLPPFVEARPVEPPGRGSRLNETPFTQMMPLARATASVLTPFLDKPYAFFGHSMGASLAFEVARLLRDEKSPTPVQLFVSARRAPHMVDSEPHVHALPEEEFKEELRRFNGTPLEVLEHPELMEVMLPLLRADFCVSETYIYQPGAPLDCPVAVFGGLEDQHVSREQLEGWREHTTGPFTLQMMKGDHFFINTAQSLLLQTLSGDLHKIMSSRAVK